MNRSKVFWRHAELLPNWDLLAIHEEGFPLASAPALDVSDPTAPAGAVILMVALGVISLATVAVGPGLTHRL
jgi:hypothetical protein